MTFLPIVDRELRVASRRRGTYWTRAIVAFGCVGIGSFLLLDEYAVAPAVLGKRIFEGLSYLGLIYCLLAGRRSTADSLSEEKREGTLGLLFLTDLKGYDVVFGKIAATSLNSFYALLAMLPVMAIPLLLGGVSSGEFWRAVLMLIDTFLLSLAIGIAASAVSHDSRKAMGLNLLLLFAVIAFPPALCATLAYALPTNPFFRPLMFSCPVFGLYMSDDTYYRRWNWLFWGTVAVIFVLTWLFTWLACIAVPHSWQDKAAPEEAHRGAKKSWRQKWRQFKYGTFNQRLALRRRLMERGAYFWLAARGRFSHVQVWLFLLLIAGWWVWGWLQTRTAWSGETLNPVNLMTAILVNSALKIWFTIEAGRQLSEDRKTGAFELLLVTPLGPEAMLRGQWRALIRQFLFPILVVIGAGLLFMRRDVQWDSMNRMLTANREIAGLPVWLWTTGLFIFLLDLVALGWVSMWTALRSRGANQATAGALIRILVLPWIVFWIVSVIDETSNRSTFTAQRQPQWPFFLAWYFFLSVASDLIFGILAYSELRHKFRLLATSHHSSLTSFFKGKAKEKPAE